jgi:hypothetical protein
MEHPLRAIEMLDERVPREVYAPEVDAVHDVAKPTSVSRAEVIEDANVPTIMNEAAD